MGCSDTWYSNHAMHVFSFHRLAEIWRTLSSTDRRCAQTMSTWPTVGHGALVWCWPYYLFGAVTVTLMLTVGFPNECSTGQSTTRDTYTPKQGQVATLATPPRSANVWEHGKAKLNSATEAQEAYKAFEVRLPTPTYRYLQLMMEACFFWFALSGGSCATSSLATPSVQAQPQQVPRCQRIGSTV